MKEKNNILVLLIINPFQESLSGYFVQDIRQYLMKHCSPQRIPQKLNSVSLAPVHFKEEIEVIRGSLSMGSFSLAISVVNIYSLSSLQRI